MGERERENLYASMPGLRAHVPVFASFYKTHICTYMYISIYIYIYIHTYIHISFSCYEAAELQRRCADPSLWVVLCMKDPWRVLFVRVPYCFGDLNGTLT